MEDKNLLFDQSIKNIELIFLISGINIKSGVITTSDLIKSRLIFIIEFLWVNTDLLGEVYWFIDGVRSGYDFFGLTHNAPCMSITFLSTVKSTLLVLNEKHVHDLMENLRNMEKRERGREQTKEKTEMINNEKDFLDTVIKAVNRLYVVVMLTFALIPILIMSVNYINTGRLELVLPFLIRYPFDPFKIRVFPLVYLHQVWSELVVFLNVSGPDYFFFTCCTYLRIQFKLLQNSIENLIPLQNDLNKTFSNDNEFKEKFKELIKWHQGLIESSLILETIYSKSTLLNFLSSSLIICLTGFNVMMVDDVVIVVAFLGFLFVGLFQVFFLCYFADLLTAASLEVTASVYKSQWYMADVSVGKQLLLIQTRSQKPCKLTAFGFADVNLNSFMRVLSTAWSYFALLQKIYGNK